MSLNILNLLFTITRRPFKRTSDNIRVIISDILIITGLILQYSISNNNNDNNNGEDEESVYG